MCNHNVVLRPGGYIGCENLGCVTLWHETWACEEEHKKPCGCYWRKTCDHGEYVWKPKEPCDGYQCSCGKCPKLTVTWKREEPCDSMKERCSYCQGKEFHYCGCPRFEQPELKPICDTSVCSADLNRTCPVSCPCLCHGETKGEEWPKKRTIRRRQEDGSFKTEEVEYWKHQTADGKDCPCPNCFKMRTEPTPPQDEKKCFMCGADNDCPCRNTKRYKEEQEWRKVLLDSLDRVEAKVSFTGDPTKIIDTSELRSRFL